MRNFVAGLHRIQDDLALAYTLIVSAVESLAQDFDGFEPTWDDVDDRMRTAVDHALVGVSADIGERVRAAILSTQRVKHRNRYRGFVLAHIDDAYFRRKAVVGLRPVARFELDPALRQAYDLRSAYIHELQPLPTAIALPPPGHWESTAVERRPALTFQGLCSVTRHVIKAFVARGPKVDHEIHDYTLEQAGVVSMNLAPQYWIWKRLGDASHARLRLEGLLEQVAAVLRREPHANLVDLKLMLADVERILPKSRKEYRPALIQLHILFNKLLSPEQRTPGFAKFLEMYNEEAGRPGIESVIVATLLDATSAWTIESHRRALDEYFAERVQRRGLHAPRSIEAAICLVLSEKYRGAGRLEDAKAMISRAVETWPAHTPLIVLENEFDGKTPINWRQTLLPPDEK